MHWYMKESCCSNDYVCVSQVGDEAFHVPSYIRVEAVSDGVNENTYYGSIVS